jgi:hypothetical protein
MAAPRTRAPSYPVTAFPSRMRRQRGGRWAWRARYGEYHAKPHFPPLYVPATRAVMALLRPARRAARHRHPPRPAADHHCVVDVPAPCAARDSRAAPAPDAAPVPSGHRASDRFPPHRLPFPRPCGTRAARKASAPERRVSSVVEHTIGNGEVDSSILSRGTRIHDKTGGLASGPHRARVDECDRRRGFRHPP